MSDKYDISWGQQHPTIDVHFCREWDDDKGGCYGTNPDHGYSIEEAAEVIAQWHEEQMNLWRSGNHPDISFFKDPSHG